MGQVGEINVARVAEQAMWGVHQEMRAAAKKHGSLRPYESVLRGMGIISEELGEAWKEALAVTRPHATVLDKQALITELRQTAASCLFMLYVMEGDHDGE